MSNNQKPQDLFLLEGINCVAFNKDFTKVAIIIQVQVGGWEEISKFINQVLFVN